MLVERSNLTPRMRECFQCIDAYCADHGVAPTYETIMDKLGLRSKGAVARLIEALESRGWITRRPNHKQSITIVPAPSDHKGPRQFTLPPKLEQQLLHLCAHRGESPHSIVADAVALFLDDIEDMPAG